MHAVVLPSPKEICPQNPPGSMKLSGSDACTVNVTVSPAVGVAGAAVAASVAGWFMIGGS